MKQFWIRGFERTGLADLEACTGLGRQSLYNAFGDKRALFEKTLEHYRQTYVEPFITRLGAAGSPMENIEAVLDMWEQSSRENEHRGCLVANSLAELGAREPELQPFLSETLDRLEKAFRRALTRAKKEGELEEDRDVKSIARLLTTLGQGLSVVNKVQGSAFSRDAIRAARSLLR